MTPSYSIACSRSRVPFSPLLVFLGFAWNDVINYSVQTPIGNVMLVDCLFVASLAVVVRELKAFAAQKVFLWFPALLLLYLLVGFVSGAGVKAISDCRQFYHFFFLFLGFAFARRVPHEGFTAALHRVLFSLALGGFLLFLVEIIIGHGFGLAIMSSEETDYGLLEDERGVRILGSTETFNLCLFVVFTYLFRSEWTSKVSRFFSVLFFTAVLISQNRTPIIATIIALVFLNVVFFRIKKGKGHRVLLNAFFVVLLCLGVYLLDYFNILPLFSSLRSATSIENDEIGTSKFRLLGALGALEVFSRHVLFGEGLGNGWQIDFGFAVLNIPPHNQYAAVLAKTGLVGFAAFFAYLWKSFTTIKAYGRSLASQRNLVRFATVVAVAQIPFGFGFEFHPFFPFFTGLLLTRLVPLTRNNESHPDYHTHL